MRPLFSPFNMICLLLLALSYLAYREVRRTPPPPKVPELQRKTQNVSAKLYFSTPNMDGYRTEQRQLAVAQNLPSQLAQAALAAWVKGPSAGGLAVVPPDSEVPKVWLRGDHFLVDLPASYTRLNYGTTGEQMVLCTITQTLLSQRGTDVKFLLAGKDTTTLLGHLDLQSPYTRAECNLGG